MVVDRGARVSDRATIATHILGVRESRWATIARGVHRATGVWEVIIAGGATVARAGVSSRARVSSRATIAWVNVTSGASVSCRATIARGASKVQLSSRASRGSIAGVDFR